jgi:hypothetical protein
MIFVAKRSLVLKVIGSMRSWRQTMLLRDSGVSFVRLREVSRSCVDDYLIHTDLPAFRLGSTTEKCVLICAGRLMSGSAVKAVGSPYAFTSVGRLIAFFPVFVTCM